MVLLAISTFLFQAWLARFDMVTHKVVDNTYRSIDIKKIPKVGTFTSDLRGAITS